MFRSISATPSDIITGISIPVLREPPNQAVQVLNEYGQEANFTKYESIILASTTAMYKRYLNWNKIYIMKFPNNYSALPAITTEDGKIVVNDMLSTASYSLKTNSVSVQDASDFCACILYGINYDIFRNMDNDNVISEAYKGIVNYVYSLLGRIYAREIDFTKISNQDIANMYYAVCMMVLNVYFSLYGSNINGICKTMTHNFFVGDKNIRVSYNPNMFPTENITSYDMLFKYLDSSNILPSVTLDDFRSKVIQSFSLTGLICMSTGLTLSSMIVTSKLPSNVINDRIGKVRPQSSVKMFSLVMQYLTKKIKAENDSIEDKSFPSEWGWN